MVIPPPPLSPSPSPAPMKAPILQTSRKSAALWNQSKRLMRMPTKICSKEVVPQAYAHTRRRGASRHRHKAHKSRVGEHSKPGFAEHFGHVSP